MKTASIAHPEFNAVDFVIDYENGHLSEAQIIRGFQALIDTGVVWHLQGSYQRTAAALIGAGLCTSND